MPQQAKAFGPRRHEALPFVKRPCPPVARRSHPAGSTDSRAPCRLVVQSGKEQADPPPGRAGCGRRRCRPPESGRCRLRDSAPTGGRPASARRTGRRRAIRSAQLPPAKLPEVVLNPAMPDQRPGVVQRGKAMIGADHPLEERPARWRIGAQNPAQLAAERLPVQPGGVGAQMGVAGRRRWSRPCQGLCQQGGMIGAQNPALLGRLGGRGQQRRQAVRSATAGTARGTAGAPAPGRGKLCSASARIATGPARSEG